MRREIEVEVEESWTTLNIRELFFLVGSFEQMIRLSVLMSLFPAGSFYEA